MKDTILERLKVLEEEKDVTILYACESGSRAWGFASSDSDYDVRFIYKHKRDKYLSIEDFRDVIELPVNEVLDISGWDIRKALKLFRTSNPPLYEWLQSPIVYKKQVDFTELLTSLMPEFFSLRAGLHHYTSMARNAFENDLQAEEVKVKKYFYALRPLLAALWITDKEVLPPMEFSILRQMIHDDAWQLAIENLLVLKREATEKSTIKRIDYLNGFIKDKLDYCYSVAGKFPAIQTSSDKLNILFRQSI